MPFTYSLDGTRPPLVVLRGRGEVSLVLWAHAMRQVIADRAFRDTMPIVLDVSEAVGTPKPEELVVIAAIWRLLAPQSQGAIVVPEGERLRIARQLEDLSHARVRAFPDLGAAMDWLAAATAMAPVPSEFPSQTAPRSLNP
jgi:hypothetical protein